jgi:hypothetical protein
MIPFLISLAALTAARCEDNSATSPYGMPSSFVGRGRRINGPWSRDPSKAAAKSLEAA